jgi:hypothetical protein
MALRAQYMCMGCKQQTPFFRSSSGQNVWVTSRALMRAHTKNVIDIDKKRLLGFVSIKCDKNIRIKSFLKKFFLQ